MANIKKRVLKRRATDLTGREELLSATIIRPVGFLKAAAGGAALGAVGALLAGGFGGADSEAGTIAESYPADKQGFLGLTNQRLLFWPGNYRAGDLGWKADLDFVSGFIFQGRAASIKITIVFADGSETSVEAQRSGTDIKGFRKAVEASSLLLQPAA